MTICAAAICREGDHFAVIGIADQKYTKGVGDDQTEYESRHSKFHFFRPNVVCLTAGDGNYAQEICRLTVACLQAQDKETSGQVTVESVAALYAQNHTVIRNRKSESILLSALNLNLESFVAGQHGLPESVVSDTIEKMRDTAMDLGTESLVFGVDSTGPSIYHVFEPGQFRSVGKNGFWSIGIGSRLFDTVFMSQPLSYDANWPIMDALLIAFSAKAQSELAPGVGEDTEVVIVREAAHRMLLPEAVNILGKRHEALVLETANLRFDHTLTLGQELDGRI